MDISRLQALIDRFGNCRIAILGDFFLDKYLDVDPGIAEISIETGRTAHQLIGIRCSPGAAGTVVNNLAALGAGQLHLLGFTGDDGEGFELRRALERLGCNLDGLIPVPGRFTPTYLKPRDCKDPALGGEHERYDTKNRRPTPDAVQGQVIARLERLLPGVDAVIILDQVEEPECGIVTTQVREVVVELGRRYADKILWADSRRRIGLFRNVVIKINAQEAIKETSSHAASPADDDALRRAVVMLRERAGRPVYVTSGARGIWVSDPQLELVRGVRVGEPTDPTGAGDSATAGAVLALCSGANPTEAALVANLVASITVQQLATTGIAFPEQLGPRLEMWRTQA